MGRPVFQSERNAELLIDVLRRCVRAGKFQLHDFVVMSDHVHVLLTVGAESTIERAMQLIKGGFSYRIKKELGYLGEVWQRGFSGLRVDGRGSYWRHRDYIAQNPVRAGLVDLPDKFPYSITYLEQQKAAGAKAR
jgi:putative transposase